MLLLLFDLFLSLVLGVVTALPLIFLSFTTINITTVMKVTNIERMTQLGSSIKTLASVINDNIDATVLDTKLSKISNMTIADALNRIIILSDIVCGQADEARYYYADIELPYTEDTFPVEHR